MAPGRGRRRGAWPRLAAAAAALVACAAPAARGTWRRLDAVACVVPGDFVGNFSARDGGGGCVDVGVVHVGDDWSLDAPSGRFACLGHCGRSCDGLHAASQCAPAPYEGTPCRGAFRAEAATSAERPGRRWTMACLERTACEWVAAQSGDARPRCSPPLADRLACDSVRGPPRGRQTTATLSIDIGSPRCSTASARSGRTNTCEPTSASRVRRPRHPVAPTGRRAAQATRARPRLRSSARPATRPRPATRAGGGLGGRRGRPLSRSWPTSSRKPLSRPPNRRRERRESAPVARGA
ncbi:hypothetical protein M885DRAFT_550576 [Pelagophyceae sp. CCMP2097]|nr:hypothetical protein M885DRAFT_550576 [Pelagophyceae sp. CCMP2097]